MKSRTADCTELQKVDAEKQSDVRMISCDANNASNGRVKNKDNNQSNGETLLWVRLDGMEKNVEENIHRID